MMSRLPLLRLTGHAEEQGRLHGLQAAELIHHNWAVYRRRFRVEARLNERDVLRQAELWRRRIADSYPNYARTMSAIAAASDLPLLAVVALNVRYELLYSAFARQGLAGEECTAAALLPGRVDCGRTLMAHNWDWIPEVKLVWLHQDRGGHQHQVLAVTEAGVVGPKIGINSAGLAMAVNGLVSHLDRWDGPGIPFHVRCHRVLGARTLEDAMAAAEEGDSPCSASFLLSGPRSAVAVERAPSGATRVHATAGILVHANHFLAASELGIHQPLGDERRSTYHRWRRMNALLSARTAWNEESLKQLLQDHDGYPDSICRHPIPEIAAGCRYATSLALVLDPEAGSLYYAPGLPCRSTYGSLSLRGL
ncbi:MAG: C45 family peptidase [Candidatus Bipolaricaulota bacterium]